jgi:HSP20 family protein
MLAQWDPFAELSRLQGMFGRPMTEAEKTFRPAVDIYEDESGVHLKADLAGVDPKDIKVHIDNGVLTISGERKEQKEHNDKGYHRVERFYGSFSRSFSLSDELNDDDIDARFDNGVLSLNLPRRPATKPKAVAIKTT